MKTVMGFLLFYLLTATAAAQVNYQFNDSPRPEADVVIANYRLVIDGAETWLIGRLFNRGLKPAHNVRVIPNLYNSRSGGSLPATTIDLRPSDIPPTSFADFSDRVSMFADRDVVARPTAEWSQ